MTTQEMIDSFLLQYDLNGSGAVAGFTDGEIIEFLNKAQLDIVKKGFSESGPELFPVLIENTGLILAPADPALQMPNTFITGLAGFPTDFLFYIGSSTNLIRSKFPVITPGDWVSNRRIEASELFRYRANQSDMVIFYNPVVLLAYTDRGIGIMVTTDFYTTVLGNYQDEENCVLLYLREPISIEAGISSEIEDRWHQEIVDGALFNAMMVTNDVRIRGAKQPKTQ